MYRAKRLYLLLGLLAVACIAAFVALNMEEHQEQIETSGQTVLEIDPADVEALSWSCEEGDFSFRKDEQWVYEEDEAFPADEEKITQLLEQFQAFNAAFVITDVEDFGQYGLDEPVCTIELTTAEETYEILLGDYSTMDSQRYVSTGDGNVYLAVSDPLEAYNVPLKELIDNDDIPSWSQVTDLTFPGAQAYSVFYEEDSASSYSYSADDVYFTQQSGKTLPLDTAKVNSYLSTIRYLDLSDYVTYSATDEDLSTYGLDNPELTITVDYTAEDEDGEDISGTFILHVSRDPQELAAVEEEQAQSSEEESQQTEETEEDEEEEEEITAYARVGDSPILYQISSDDYTALMAASYDDLRHEAAFWGDFADITQIDVSLDGADYTLTVQGEEDDRTYWYQEEEVDITQFQEALEALSADEFTTQQPTEQEEISLTLYLDNEAFPQIQLPLYRYDGTHCLAVIDQTPVSLIPREQVVDVMEALRAIVLG